MLLSTIILRIISYTFAAPPVAEIASAARIAVISICTIVFHRIGAMKTLTNRLRVNYGGEWECLAGSDGDSIFAQDASQQKGRVYVSCGLYGDTADHRPAKRIRRNNHTMFSDNY